MSIPYELVYDILALVRIRVADEELEVEEVINMIESEISSHEQEDYL